MRQQPSKDDEPILEHLVGVFDDGQGGYSVGGKTGINDETGENYEAKVALASSVLISMQQVTDNDEGEFIEDVINDYNGRKKAALSERLK